MRWWSGLCRVAYGFSAGMLLVGAMLFVVGGVLWRSVSARLVQAQDDFSQEAGRTVYSILPEIMAGYAVGQVEPLSASRWLLLGKDEVEGSGRTVVLTDTIIVMTYQPAQGQMNLISLPRDWYHPDLATKINALYTYGSQRNPGQPTKLLSQTLTEMLGIEFDHVLELSLVQVREVIDALGGIEINVERSFTDDRFPRSGVDVTRVSDPLLLFESISFSEGPQLMDGETALKFMRSRNSTDPEEGNDEARAHRQQLVIQALAESFSSPRVLSNPTVLGRLYRWYADNFQDSISLFEMGRLLGALAQSEVAPQLNRIDLPEELLVHPPVTKYGQWVYESVDPTFQSIHDFIQQSGL